MCAAFEVAHKTYGRVDIVFANAGITDMQIGEDFFFTDPTIPLDTQEANSKVMDVNYLGSLNAVRLGIHYFALNTTPGGPIVMTLSGCIYLDEQIPMYSASKYALRGLMRSLRHAAPAHNITISSIAPHVTETGMMPEGARAIVEARGVPVNDASSCARAAAWLVSGGGDRNGKTVFIGDNKFWEIEDAFDESRKGWLGERWVNLSNTTGKGGQPMSKSGWSVGRSNQMKKD